MINIDFLLAGCNTRCMHCYVAGGKLNPFGTAALYDTKKYPPASAGTFLSDQAENQVGYDHHVHQDVVQVRDYPGIAGGEDPDCIPETFVIPLQFQWTGAEKRVIPVAAQLDTEPQHQDAGKDPFSRSGKTPE